MTWQRIIAAVLFGAAPYLASACSTPVFRYALEYWAPDSYDIVARNAKTWPANQRAALRLLQDAERYGQANLRVQTEPPETKAGPATGTNALPRMEVSFPDIEGLPRTVWSGEPSADIARRLLHSPARAEIARLLLQGKAAVWVLLESGNSRKDNAAARLLAKELRRLESTLTTLDPGEWVGSADLYRQLKDMETTSDGQKALAEIAPKCQSVSFGMLRLRRNDPAETFLVQMLLNSEPNLEKSSDEAITFPIYGRGFVLDALTGGGINPRVIGEAAEFLIGPCACLFKEAYHGASLLMTVDWESGIKEKTLGAGGGGPVGTAGFLQRIEKDEGPLDKPAPSPGKGKTKK